MWSHSNDPVTCILAFVDGQMDRCSLLHSVHCSEISPGYCESAKLRITPKPQHAAVNIRLLRHPGTLSAAGPAAQSRNHVPSLDTAPSGALWGDVGGERPAAWLVTGSSLLEMLLRLAQAAGLLAGGLGGGMLTCMDDSTKLLLAASCWRQAWASGLCVPACGFVFAQAHSSVEQCNAGFWGLVRGQAGTHGSQ